MLNGLTSIRAYRLQDQFIEHLESQVDDNTISSISGDIAAEWLSIRLDILGALITFFIGALAVGTVSHDSNGKPTSFISPGFLALGLTNSFQITAVLKYFVRMVAMLEAQMNAIERVMFYVVNVPQEGNGNENAVVPADWPSRGHIVASDGLAMRYRDGPLVLKGVNFEINGKEKIGIAGRTGSGKSSLMIALFRIEELAGGKVIIDDIDISTVPLKTLRSRLGIIPQDPVLFSASLRFNLDPFDEHTDTELWDVLQAVSMKEKVQSLDKALLEEVTEGGENFSAGQRQLICIARALLRHPKILVLDEATASIDNETDALIQVMVREQFKDTSVLTIAHRLHTIIDADRIMVLEKGRLAEFGSPDELLKKDAGLFKLLWERHQLSHSNTASL